MEINGIGSSRSDIHEMLSKIREISNKSKFFVSEPEKIHSTGQISSFENVISTAKNAMSSVNSMTVETEKLNEAYIAGDANVSMSQLLISSQKSKLAFEGLISVRNKILEAYKEIMNMPI